MLVTAPLARAGGAFVDLTVGSTRVCFVGEPGVREIDARTGRTVASPRLVRAAYPLSVALAGGAAWVASVEGGYVEGTLTRIDLRTHKVRVLWRRYDSSVQYVAAGVGGVWAMIGSRTSPTGRIARFGLDGRLQHVWQIAETGRMAADGSGCWISTERWLLHIDASGRIHRVLRARLGDVAAGAGAIWLPQQTTVLRVDERTGRTRALDPLLAPLPAHPALGSLITIRWSVDVPGEHGRRVPFGASGMFVRFVGRGGGSTSATASQYRPPYRVRIRVPAGGIRSVRFGLEGTSCGPTGCRPSPIFFPLK